MTDDSTTTVPGLQHLHAIIDTKIPQIMQLFAGGTDQLPEAAMVPPLAWPWLDNPTVPPLAKACPSLDLPVYPPVPSSPSLWDTPDQPDNVHSVLG